MNFNVFGRQGSQEDCAQESNTSKKKSSLWHRRSLRGNRDRQRQNVATLPRVCKPKLPTTLVDYSDPQRTTIVLEKQDNEAYGFEIEPYELSLRSCTAVEMCTLVCTVQEDSVAESAGLTAGDIVVTVNGVSVEGTSHQRILELIKESTNRLKIETVSGNVVKQIELEKKLNQLKQSLHEKLIELQMLDLKEKRLVRGKTSDSRLHPSIDSDVSSPCGHWGQRRSSDSSFRSAMTVDSDQVSVFGDICSPSPLSAANMDNDGCFFSSKDFSAQAQRYRSNNALSSSSSLAGSSGSLSPMWDEAKASLFGTLPRKSRRASVRKHIFKLIPGLQSSVEEEDGPR